jgi:L-ascorbate metabolism protein UlaG (beta-lactamase superfamily)
MGFWTGLRSVFVEGYKGPSHPHFDGEHFNNASPLMRKSLWTVLKWRFFSRSRIPWPAWISSPSVRKQITDTDQLTWTFVNHATWLVQMDGLNMLTDPIWSRTAGPFSWLGPKRVRAPGIRLEDLPRIDAVLVSHNHYDHLDIPTLERLEARDHPLFIVGLGNASFLRKFGLQKIQELDWWQSVHIGQTAFHFVPARHWSRRGFYDTNKTLWGGYVLTGKTQTVYFAGDTGYGPHFKSIREKFPAIDIALLPIGAYEPRWFMSDSHMNPAEAVQASLDLAAKKSFGMHFGTFQLSEEAIHQPAEDVAQAREQAGLPTDAFQVPEFGKTYSY